MLALLILILIILIQLKRDAVAALGFTLPVFRMLIFRVATHVT